LQKEKALLPSAIEQGQAQAQTAVAQADTSKLDNALKHTTSAIQTIQPLLTKPDLTSDDVITATREHAKRFGTPESAVNQVLANLPVNGTPAQLREWLGTSLAKTLSAQTQLEKMYPGGILPSQLPEGGYQTNRQGTEAPTSATAPAPAAAPKSGVQPQDMSQPVKSEFSKPVPLSYQVRQAGQAFTALPQEEADRKVGTEFRNNLVSRLPNMATERRNIDETITLAMYIALDKSAKQKIKKQNNGK
jgi:hypothetical protein